MPPRSLPLCEDALTLDNVYARFPRLAERHAIFARGRLAWQGSSNEFDAGHGLLRPYLGV